MVAESIQQADNVMERGEVRVSVASGSSAPAGVSDRGGGANGEEMEISSPNNNGEAPQKGNADEEINIPLGSYSKSGREGNYWSSLSACIRASHLTKLGPDSQIGFLDFKHLAEINILHLQNELVKSQDLTEEPRGPEDMRQLGDNLHRYTIALQDYAYIRRTDDWESVRTIRDTMASPEIYFPAIYKRAFNSHLLRSDISFVTCPQKHGAPSDPLRNWLKYRLPKNLAWDREEIIANPMWDVRGMTPQKISPFVDRLARFVVAVSGGLSLVIPMLIMRLHPSLKKSLITTSVAVLLFAGAVSVVFKASNAETLAITATYAAVLVVFLGTSS